jgi:hypothetical protein
MGSIYKHCCLCIAATAGKDISDGLLKPCELEHKRPFIYYGLVVQENVAMANENFIMRQELTGQH